MHICHNRHCNLVENIIMMMFVIITSTKTKISTSIQILFYKTATYKVQLSAITMVYH